MITFFNKLGNSWVAKLILGALALSMLAFWGLGGLANLSAYNSSGDIVKVGNKGLTPQQLNQSFEHARKTYARLAGNKYISVSQALKNGIFDQVLQQEISALVQESLIDRFGLAASNESVAAYVEQNPVFKDNTGKFDKNLFYAYLMQTDLSEAQLSERLKKELAFKHLQDSLTGLKYAPELIVKAANNYKNEKRIVSVMTILPNNIVINEQPSEQDLKDYYEAYAEELMNPEYRSLTVLPLTPELMMQRVKIDENEVNARYEEQKDTYNKPEERDLYQMFFKSESAANETKNIVTPENFEETALKNTTQTPEDTHFGLTAKNQLMEELAEPVFKAEKNEIVGPVHSQAGWHILWVKDIVPAQTQPAETVKAQIRKALAADEAYDALENLVRETEDVLGTGASLKEAAKKLNLQTVTVNKTDIAGNLADGKTIPENMKNQELLQNVFILKKGDVSSFVRNGDGYLVAEIDEITPVMQKPFDQVKEELRAKWVHDKQVAALDKTTESILADIRAGKEPVLPPQTVTLQKEVFTRENNAGLGENLNQNIFHQAVGTKNAQAYPVNESRFVVVVHEIQPGDKTEITSALKEETAAGAADILKEAFLQNYMKNADVQVNEKALQTLMKNYQGEE